jgi:hypothetical protein
LAGWSWQKPDRQGGRISYDATHGESYTPSLTVGLLPIV